MLSHRRLKKVEPCPETSPSGILDSASEADNYKSNVRPPALQSDMQLSDILHVSPAVVYTPFSSSAVH